ncbi:MAG: hypothetical protein EXS31_02680 [Pedosphaera sp.]|nr:hypothetical protein [Pedosphaera sp.]
MKIRVIDQARATASTRSESASVLIIVLWVSFGLVALTLYFAHSMSLDMRAADNAVASLEAEKAIEGAARYVSNVLATVQIQGVLPETNTYYNAALPVGDATFWLIGPTDSQDAPTVSHFGLVDEASKLNINTATLAMIQTLPLMTPEFAASIIDWRDTNETVTENGAESEMYQRLNPPYRCKNAPFETIEELRLVYGADLGILFGEDVNLNGVLDLNENDGAISPPFDNQNGRLEPGILSLVTVYSRDATTISNTTQRLNVGATNFQQRVATILQNAVGADRANTVLRRIAGGTGGGGGRGGGGGVPVVVNFTSVLDFYVRSGLSVTEFTQIEDQLRNPNTNGLVNVNTASDYVLSCIPGIGVDKAQSVVASRRSQTKPLTSVAWLRDVLDQTSLLQAAPYLTGKSYQFTADIAAVGHYGRGYRRVKFIFDTSAGTPRIVFRQDLTHMGWALGRDVRLSQQMLANKL